MIGEGLLQQDAGDEMRDDPAEAMWGGWEE
jgi:hypothetical protein